MLPQWLEEPDPGIYLTGSYVVLDFETTNLDKGNACNKDNSILFAAWKCSWEREAHQQWGNEYGFANTLLRDIESASFIVAHNAKFECKWLARAGLDLRRLLVYDTQIAEYVIAGNRKRKLDLGSVSKRYGYGGKDPYVDILMKSGVCPSQLPQSLVADRCVKDIYQTEGVFKKQRELLNKKGLLPCTFTRCIFSPCLADIELNGMYLSKDKVLAEYNELHAKMAELTAELDLFTGGINMRSAPQKKEFIYDVLKFKPLKLRGKEVFGTDKDTIVQLKATNKKQRKFKELMQEFGKVNALLTKSAEFMRGVCLEKDGLFYAQFNQTITKTHRLSSSGISVKFDLYDKPKKIQFQNFPRVYKKMFKARKAEWLMGEIDGAQLEFRVAAYLGQDVRATQDIVDDVDVHQFTADTLTNAGQQTSRQEAKSRTFKPLFGGESGTKAEQTYYKAFKEKYNGVAAAQKQWLMEVAGKKSLRLHTGLMAYWPDTRVTGTGYITNSTQICNLPVQNLATAEIIPVAVTYLWHRMEGMESFLTNTIHDSAIAEISPNEVELFNELGVQSFTNDVYYYLDRVYNIQFNVPLGAGFKAGEHWGEGEEVKTTTNPSYRMEGVNYECA